MRRAVDQPSHIEVDDGASKVSDPKRHPWVFVPEVDGHERRQAKGENRVENFVMTAGREIS
jgi:hypothetical protein